MRSREACCLVAKGPCPFFLSLQKAVCPRNDECLLHVRSLSTRAVSDFSVPWLLRADWWWQFYLFLAVVRPRDERLDVPTVDAFSLACKFLAQHNWHTHLPRVFISLVRARCVAKKENDHAFLASPQSHNATQAPTRARAQPLAFNNCSHGPHVGLSVCELVCVC